MSVSKNVLEHFNAIVKAEAENYSSNNIDRSIFHSASEMKSMGFRIIPVFLTKSQHLAFKLVRFDEESGEVSEVFALFNVKAFDEFPELNDFKANKKSILDRLCFADFVAENGEPGFRAYLSKSSVIEFDEI